MKQNGTNGQAPQPNFGLSAPTYNFDALIDGTRCTPFVYELDLSTARSYTADTAVQVKITGNCCLIDSAPDVGMASIIFEGVQDFTAGQIRAPIYCRPGFVTRVPFANLYIANHAQPGKVLRIIYGVDIDFQEMSPARVGSVEQPFDYQAVFQSTANLAAGGNVAAITPAANVDGAILHRAIATSNAASANYCALLANTSAPAAWNDGEMLGYMATNGNTIAVELLQRPVFIPAGKGVYFTALTAETFANHLLQYTLV